MRIAVIGAGVAGITTAYFLAKEGYEVYVYDQEPHAGMRTSYANGGQISVSNSEVWTTWSNVYKGIKWMFKKDAPLLIRPSLDWDKISWILKFLYYTANNDYARNTVNTIKLGIESRRIYEEILKEENLEIDQSPSGILHFYKDNAYFAHAASLQEMYKASGCEWDVLSPKQVQSLDPALKDIDSIVGGVWTPSDWTGDIHKYCYQLAEILKEKYKVIFFYNKKVEDLDIEFNYYDRVVIASGVGSIELSRSLKDKIPVYPVKGYSITINNVDSKLLPKVSLLDDQAKIVTATLGNRFRVAGTAELAGENYDIRRDRIEPLLKWVRTNFPKINTHDYSSWACLRPMTPNMMPIIRRSKNPKVYYHTGHGHLGWTLSAATAKLLTQQIKGEF